MMDKKNSSGRNSGPTSNHSGIAMIGRVGTLALVALAAGCTASPARQPDAGCNTIGAAQRISDCGCAGYGDSGAAADT